MHLLPGYESAVRVQVSRTLMAGPSYGRVQAWVLSPQRGHTVLRQIRRPDQSRTAASHKWEDLIDTVIDSQVTQLVWSIIIRSIHSDWPHFSCHTPAAVCLRCRPLTLTVLSCCCRCRLSPLNRHRSCSVVTSPNRMNRSRRSEQTKSAGVCSYLSDSRRRVVLPLTENSLRHQLLFDSPNAILDPAAATSAFTELLRKMATERGKTLMKRKQHQTSDLHFYSF